MLHCLCFKLRHAREVSTCTNRHVLLLLRITKATRYLATEYTPLLLKLQAPGLRPLHHPFRSLYEPPDNDVMILKYASMPVGLGRTGDYLRLGMK